MLTTELITQLKAPFAPQEHEERVLPGKDRKKWLFIPWQRIRDRLTEVCPDWECSYSDPVLAADFAVIRCKITLYCVTREGIGNSNAYPEKPQYGSPIERARADAFKEAAEQFGIGAYLDNQKFVADYLKKKGDYRASGYLAQNRIRDSGFTPRNPQQLIDQEQLKKFHALVNEKRITKEQALKIINQFGYESSKAITQANYQAIMEAIRSA